MFTKIRSILSGFLVSIFAATNGYATGVEDTVEAKLWVVLLIEKAMEYKATKSIIALIGAIVFFIGISIAFSSRKDKQWGKIIGGVAVSVAGLSIINLISGFMTLMAG